MVESIILKVHDRFWGVFWRCIFKMSYCREHPAQAVESKCQETCAGQLGKSESWVLRQSDALENGSKLLEEGKASLCHYATPFRPNQTRAFSPLHGPIPPREAPLTRHFRDVEVVVGACVTSTPPAMAEREESHDHRLCCCASSWETRRFWLGVFPVMPRFLGGEDRGIFGEDGSTEG